MNNHVKFDFLQHLSSMAQASSPGSMAFRDLAEFCQAVVKVGPKSGKEAKFKKLVSFLEFSRTQMGRSVSLFPIIRLLLPQLDRERGSYGIKETVLARLFIRSLGLGEGSADAIRLKNFRAPKGLGSQSDTGDFAAVLYTIIQDRGYPDGQLSVDQINVFLDQLVEAGAQGGKRALIETLLMDVFKKMNPVQVKWVVRIILKDMRLGLGQSTIFKAVHPDAKELYEVNANLAKVCDQLKDPSIRLNEIAVQLFHPFKPMLAERGVLERVEQQMGHKSFFIEVKYDGERLQIHKNEKDDYKYFSRNCHDFTSDFGESPREWGSFTQILSQCLSSHVHSVILDGEICAYNHQTDCLTLKGDKMNIRGLKSDDPMYQQCLYAYDVLFLNGQVLTNKPLLERIEILKSVVQERKGRIHFAQRCEGSTKAEVIQALNEAIDRREEGIVLKDVLSIYKPNARSGGGWLKIKPDYSNQLTDQCDLVLMGGYYGTGRKGRGIISHFLLGLVAVDQEKHKDVKCGSRREIHSFCRVGSGYSMKELYELLQRLEPHFIRAKWDSGPSDDLVRVDDFALRMGREKPDVIISPKKSVILQINAAEVIASDVYHTGCTLRFPRVEQIRTDKSLDDCMTTKDLETIRREAQGKLSRRYVESEASSDEPSKKRRRQTNVKVSQTMGLAKAFGPAADLSTVMIESHNLKDQVIVIEPTNAILKARLEAIVIKHGGIVEQNPIEGRTFCYVETGLKMKAKSVVRSRKFDVVRHTWLLDCEDHYRPFGPADMVCSTSDRAQEFKDQYDEFGDPFAFRSTLTSLKYSMGQVKALKKEAIVSRDVIAEFECTQLANPSKFGLFRQLTFYLDRYAQIGQSSEGNREEDCLHPLEHIELLIEFYGGKVIKDDLENDDRLSHVVVSSSDLTRVSKLKALRRTKTKKFHLVPESYIEQCVQDGNLLSLADYDL